MATYTTNLPRVVASIAATGLVVSSAGFGAVYAYSVGIQHGIVLAGLTVLFAVALELVKPLAVHAAFQALGSWQIIRGLCLSVLGVVAVAYSLTAELALMSASRSDLAAARASQSFQARANQDRHQRASEELAKLKPSRSIPELEALIAGAKPQCRIVVTLDRRDTVCTKPPALLAELGRAKRRSELETTISNTEAAVAPMKISDPGTHALSIYLAALGIVVAADIVAQWLNLVPVLALELGSALAVVLVSSLAPSHQEATVTHMTQAASEEKPALARPVIPPVATERDRVASHLLSHLRANGGSVKAAIGRWERCSMPTGMLSLGPFIR